MNGRVARSRRVGRRSYHAVAEESQRRKDAWYAFIWHSAELAIVAALVINEPSLWLGVLLVLALLGWGWSAGHLPGEKA